MSTIESDFESQGFDWHTKWRQVHQQVHTLKYECVTVKDRYRHIFNLRLGYNVSYNLHTYKQHVGNLLHERNWLPSSVKPFDSCPFLSSLFSVWRYECVCLYTVYLSVEQHHEQVSQHRWGSQRTCCICWCFLRGLSLRPAARRPHLPRLNAGSHCWRRSHNSDQHPGRWRWPSPVTHRTNEATVRGRTRSRSQQFTDSQNYSILDDTEM